MTIQRCSWAASELAIAYHDLEWGVPVHDDRVLFEFLTLEGAQAGLSWSTILRKREHYRRAFADFDPARLARFSDAKTTSSHAFGIGSSADDRAEASWLHADPGRGGLARDIPEVTARKPPALSFR